MPESLVDPQGLLRTQAGRKQELGACLDPVSLSLLPPSPPPRHFTALCSLGISLNVLSLHKKVLGHMVHKI